MMTRWWNELVGLLGDQVPGGVPMVAFLSLLAAIVIALGWYFWPSWLPWHWRLGSAHASSDAKTPGGSRTRFRFGRLRWRWRLRFRRRRRAQDEAQPGELAADELPDLPAEALLLSADALAAAGRFKESVRERLRAIVRDLVDRGVIPFSPGWTVTELAGVASRVRPPLAPALHTAVDVFSEIWYGLRPAGAEDDAKLRSAADEVSHLLMTPVGVSGGGA